MTASDFLKRVQAYYGKQYNTVQLESLKGWFNRRSERVIDALYQEMVEVYDGRFQLPLVKDLNGILTTILDFMPELQNTAPPSGALQITDDYENRRKEVADMLADLAKHLEA